MKKRLSAIQTSVLLTGAFWPVVRKTKDDAPKSPDRSEDESNNS